MNGKYFQKSRLYHAVEKTGAGSKKILTALALTGMLYGTPAMAQQTGSIEGKIVTTAPTTGMTVTASSNVMPKARTVDVEADGRYDLPLLLPGTYELTFKSASGGEKTLIIEVLLDQTSKVNFNYADASGADNKIVITGTRVIREGDSALTNALSQDVIEGVPVGDTYRDLMKLIPGVAYSEMGTLGPNAGGSGRHNKYGFDGVDISLPMFGNLSAEPSTHDIANASIERGGAKAVGFNRSGGFSINTVSKTGTNEFSGNIQYKLQDKGFREAVDAGTTEVKSQVDRSWLTASLSGPIIEDELFFYASYYRPETTRVNKETAYGSAKDYKRVREEFYGKLTYQPIDDLLLNISMRTSDNEGRGESVGGNDADSTSVSSDSYQDIFTFDGSYIVDSDTTVSFQYSEFDYLSDSGPDNLIPGVIPVLGQSLDTNNLDQLGEFRVPTNGSGADALAQSLIDQYGYIDDNGVRQGGGDVGVGSLINKQQFLRDSFEFKLEHEMDIGESFHRLHFGFQWKENTEILSRFSNGWGSIRYIGGQDVNEHPDTYYRTITQQMSFQDADGTRTPDITSSSEQLSFEINDTIEHGDFVYNVGVLISQDTLYGQGLKANSANVSGYELAPGHKYEMHKVDFADMIQPRLGVTWIYHDRDTVFANFASYMPEATSLARAASWARNTRATLDVEFDINGNFLSSEARDGSSGKFFQEGIKPNRIDELTFGTSKSISDEIYVRAHIRRREGSHFWEDTWNNSRLYGTYGPWGGVPEDIAARGPYIPELGDYRAEVGGSSYVIAELDDAYTSYNEFSVEATYDSDRWYVNASYVWSHWYGNFENDITSGNSDGNLFIGSSNLADGRGRQLWDGKEGTLFGDKPHVLKIFGRYTTDWAANIGAYFIYQSGNVWEPWDGTPYGYSSSTIRFTDSAGSRRGPSHWQLDLNYTQDFTVAEDYTLQFRADLFNVFDRQDAYLTDPYVDNASFGLPRARYAPRRLQFSVNLKF